MDHNDKELPRQGSTGPETGPEAVRQKVALADARHPKLAALGRDLLEDIRNSSIWYERMLLAEDTTWCVWAGQTDDGLKHGLSGEGHDAYPWDKASDTRVRLVDAIVGYYDKMAAAAYRRGRWKIEGTTSRTAMEAGKLSTLLRWQMESPSQGGAIRSREHKLARHWRHMYGLAFTLTEWDRAEGLQPCEVNPGVLAGLMGMPQLADQIGLTLEEWETWAATTAAQLSQKAAPDAGPEAYAQRQQLVKLWGQAEQVLGLMRDEAALAGVLRENYPEAQEWQIAKQTAALRATGVGRLPEKVVTRNRPRDRALRCFDDIFFPTGTRNIQEAERIDVREWVSEVTARERAASGEWDKKFVEALIRKTRGKSATEGLERRRAETRRWLGARRLARTTYDVKNLFEVFHTYYRAVDEDGFPAMYRTTHSLNLARGGHAPEKDLYACHDLYEAEHGMYPVTAHELAPDGKRLLDDEGIATKLHTAQYEAKGLRDMRMDLGSLAVRPVLVRPERDAGEEAKFGPDIPLYERVRDSVRYMQPPQGRSEVAVELERTVTNQQYTWYGVPMDESVPPVIVTVNTQDLADNYGEEMCGVMMMNLQLMQQYMDPVVVTRLTGALPTPFPMSREDIQGEFDVRISFDAQSMDPKYLQVKMGVATEIMALSPNVDKNGIAGNLLTELDWQWGEAYMLDPQAAGDAEVNDEKNNIALIMSGQQPPMQKKGQNFGLRLQTMKQAQVSSAYIQQTLKTDTQRLMLWEQRTKHLATLAEQFGPNAQIGKYGVNPAEGATGPGGTG